MNYQDIVFLDFETTGKSPYTCQPTQLAAVVIDGRRLTIRDNSLFSSYIQPIFDVEQCGKLGLEPVNDEVLEKTHISLGQLQTAPTLKTVWGQFHQYINRFNPKKSRWTAPIKGGFNFDKYDSIIVDRICGGNFKKASVELDKLLSGGIIKAEGVKIPEPYGFGPWEEERQEESLFYPRDSIDLLRIVWLWTENMPEIKSLSMDAIREWLGMDPEGAHNAAKDVSDGAEVLIKFLKLHRKVAPTVNFRGKK